MGQINDHQMFKAEPRYFSWKSLLARVKIKGTFCKNLANILFSSLYFLPSLFTFLYSERSVKRRIDYFCHFSGFLKGSLKKIFCYVKKLLIFFVPPFVIFFAVSIIPEYRLVNSIHRRIFKETELIVLLILPI